MPVRYLTILVTYVAVGCACSISVALACSLLAQFNVAVVQGRATQDDIAWLNVRLTLLNGFSDTSPNIVQSIGCRIIEGNGFVKTATPINIHVQRVTVGWPLPFMDGFATQVASRKPQTHNTSLIPRSRLPGPLQIQGFLISYPLSARFLQVPYGIQSWALVANVLFYALCSGATIMFVRLLRQRLRCSRGLCITCGHDLEGTNSDVCPECGSARHFTTRYPF